MLLDRRLQCLDVPVTRYVTPVAATTTRRHGSPRQRHGGTAPRETRRLAVACRALVAIDPVHVEVADTHGTEAYVITVCDFKGRKIINYRYGPVIYHTNGGARFELPPGDGPDGRSEFECGGVMEFQGHPFMVCATDVP